MSRTSHGHNSHDHISHVLMITAPWRCMRMLELIMMTAFSVLIATEIPHLK